MLYQSALTVRSTPRSFRRPVFVVASLVCLAGAWVATASDRTVQSAVQPEFVQASITTTSASRPEPSSSAVQSDLMEDWNDIYQVPGEETPSGFDVPRFVSLKFGRVNARTGPSRNHSIAYQYQRRGLPLIIVAETEMWRKVRDVDGDEAWVRKPALSGERHAIFQIKSDILTKAEADAPAVARVEQGALVKLMSCESGAYCQVRTASGFKGYAPKAVLWGTQDMN